MATWFDLLMRLIVLFQVPGQTPVAIFSSGIATTGFITGQTIANPDNAFNGCVGTGITVGSTSLTVTKLGRWNISGNSHTHTLYITNSGGTSIVTASVDASLGTPGTYQYVNISSTTLSANTTYYVLSSETAGQDNYYKNITVATTTGGLLLGEARQSSCSGAVTVANSGLLTDGPVNFVINSLTPGSSTPYFTAQTLGTSRSNFSGCVGAFFKVGGTSITVTDLARWVISGNSQTHSIYLEETNSSGSAAVLYVNTSVNTSGQGAGYLYTTLSNPLTLPANTYWALFSVEVNLMDSWYDDNTTVTPTAAATMQGSVVGATCPGTANLHVAGNVSYVPPNFKYY